MEYKMKISKDEETGEYFLQFLDEDDRDKKSRYLKRILAAGQEFVTMSIVQESKLPTVGQQNMYKAFLILLQDYTGHERSEIKQTIYTEMKITEDEINEYNREEYSQFIEKLFKFCSYNVGIDVQNVDGKLKIITEKST